LVTQRIIAHGTDWTNLKWLYAASLLSVQSAMTKHGVVPDVIDTAPTEEAQVSYICPISSVHQKIYF
jgi:hypothetical protein